jgi:4-diphosphocytidyl-2-C-methyl-D-erythritol kinase
LRVGQRRGDGYHDIESLTAFADLHDRLAFEPGGSFGLSVAGEFAGACGPDADNLVRKAADALSRRVDGLMLGHFTLTKTLPVAAGLGGGSADAAAALRLLARSNNLAPRDPRLMAAAQSTGADVPVCLDPRPRIMRGTGEILSAPLQLPALAMLLVNPGVAVPTAAVFAALASGRRDASGLANDRAIAPIEQTSGPLTTAVLIDALNQSGNDLEAPGISLYPVIGDVLAALRDLPGCKLARMSGSGATCFALFDESGLATKAAGLLAGRRTGWWIRQTILG